MRFNTHASGCCTDPHMDWQRGSGPLSKDVRLAACSMLCGR
ncbi:hypothetical protein GGR62_000737 [Xanthomonas campestris]|nr:hypothetical protein [Xanthomonas sp. 3075]